MNRIASTPTASSSQPAAPPVAQTTAAVAPEVIRRRKRTSGAKATTSLEQAISLRDQLRVALSGSKELIRTLKTENRGQKSLKLALASLKQLQAVA